MQMKRKIDILCALPFALGLCPQASAATSTALQNSPAPAQAVVPTQPLAGTPKLPSAGSRAVLLEELTWQQAEQVLTPESVVVIPLGAASKEHGPHLRLQNDFLIAEYLKRRLLAADTGSAPVSAPARPLQIVIAPTVNYHYYPAFVQYPGATSLRLETARDLLVDIARGLARFGPRRFYVLNTGVSTVRALEPAQQELRKDGIRLAYLDWLKARGPIEKQIAQQEGGTHADELETSMMLYIAPHSVDMRRAVKDYRPHRPGGFTRDPSAASGSYSPSGVWGDPTLATRDKGALLTEHAVTTVLA